MGRGVGTGVAVGGPTEPMLRGRRARPQGFRVAHMCRARVHNICGDGSRWGNRCGRGRGGSIKVDPKMDDPTPLILIVATNPTQS